MADILLLQDLELSQSSTADNPVITVARKISSADTTLITSSPLLDKDGNVITKACIIGIKRSDGYVENCYVAAGGISGTTVTITTRGLKLGGIDLSATLAGNATSHEQGEEVFLNVAPFILQQMIEIMRGNVANNGVQWKIGDGTDKDISVIAYNADVNKPYWGYDKATNQWVFSNDGVSSTPFGTGAGVTGGDGITVTAGDIDIDLTDTTTFVSTSAGAGDAGKSVVLNASGEIDTGVSGATKTEIAQLSGTTNIAEANTFFGLTDITGVEAETLSDGSNADSLHKHGVGVKFISGTVTKTNRNETGTGTLTLSVGSADSLKVRLNFHLLCNGYGSPNTHNLQKRAGILECDFTNVYQEYIDVNSTGGGAGTETLDYYSTVYTSAYVRAGANTFPSTVLTGQGYMTITGITKNGSNIDIAYSYKTPDRDGHNNCNLTVSGVAY